MDILSFALVALAASAAAFDLGTRRIPNVLTLSGLVAALALRGSAGTDLLLAGLAGAGIAFGIALPLFLLGGLGGGDVKLLVAVGAFLGPRQLAVALFVTALAGGLLAILVSVRRRALGRTFASMYKMLKSLGLHALLRENPGRLPTLSTPGAVTVPYGLAIAAGAVAGLVL